MSLFPIANNSCELFHVKMVVLFYEFLYNMDKGCDEMTLGQKINKLRTEKKWSQEKLAEAVGVSRQAVSKWELDEAVPDVTNIILLSKIFSVSTDYLLLNEEDKKDSEKISPKKKSISKMYLIIGLLSIGLFSCLMKDTFFFGRQDDFFEGIYPSESLYTHVKGSCDVLSALDSVNSCLSVDMYEVNEGLVVDVIFPDEKDSIFYDFNDMKVTKGDCDIISSNRKVYEEEMISVLYHYYSSAYGESQLGYLNEIEVEQASHIQINETVSLITLNDEHFLVESKENSQLQKLNGNWSSDSEKYAAEWVYQFYHNGVMTIDHETYYSKSANLSTLHRVSPFVCPEDALYHISFEDSLTHVSIVGSDKVEIVAADRGVVREVKDCGEDGVYLRVTYADQSEIEYYHLSRNFWLSSETEIFHKGQLLGYAMADSDSTSSFSFSIKLGPTNEIISMEEYCRNQLDKASRTNVFEVDDCVLFDKKRIKEIQVLADREEVFKRLNPNRSVKVEGYGIVSEIFGNKTRGISFSVSSHDIHTLLIHQTDRGITGSRVIELESSLRGINNTAYSAEISLSPSMYYDGQLYQHISLSFRINGNQYAFYGTYDPVEQSFIPTDYSAPVLFPTDEVEHAIRSEVHRLYTEFCEMDQLLKEFSYEVLPYLTDLEGIEIYYPEFPKILDEVLE